MNRYWGYAQISGIYLKAEGIPGNPYLRDDLMEIMRPIIASNEIPYFQKMSVGSHKSWKEKKGNKESVGRK